jgi:hypothetical protein
MKGEDPGSAGILIPMLDRYKEKFEKARPNIGGDNSHFLQQNTVGNLMNPSIRAEIFQNMRKQIEEEEQRENELPGLSKAA